MPCVCPKIGCHVDLQSNGFFRYTIKIHGFALQTAIKRMVGGFKHDFYFPFHIWDIYIKSFPLTKSIIFQDG